VKVVLVVRRVQLAHAPCFFLLVVAILYTPRRRSRELPQGAAGGVRALGAAAADAAGLFHVAIYERKQRNKKKKLVMNFPLRIVTAQLQQISEIRT